MMVLDHVGVDEGGGHVVYAQLGQQPLARTTETSLATEPGHSLSCLSARPPDLADAAGTRNTAPGGLLCS